MIINQETINRNHISMKMGGAGTGCNRRIRAAAGLDGCGSLDTAFANRASRDTATLRGSECDRSSDGRFRSSSASGSGTSSDEEHEPQELKGFSSRRISPSGSESGSIMSRASSGPAGGFGVYRGGSGSSVGAAGLPTFVGSNQDKLQRYGSSIVDMLSSGSPVSLSMPASQKFANELQRLDSRVNLEITEADDTHLSPDVPLIYVSCISILVLLYFVLFVDGKALARLLFPIAVDEFHWHSLQRLQTGIDVGASILLAFFVWLLHALLFDIAGMLAGLVPSAITFSAVFSHRVLHHSAGFLVLALVAVACGFAFSRRLEAHVRVRQKLKSCFSR